MRSLAIVFIITGLTYAQGPSSSPGTETNRSAVNSSTMDGALASLPDLLPAPTGKATLIGGTVRRVDHVRDQMTVQVFGGRDTRLLFDDRTHFYRDGVVASPSDLKNGERIYADTVLTGTDIFARNIRILSQSPSGQSKGQVLNYESHSGELTLRDALSPEPLKVQLAASTMIVNGDRNVSATELRPGTLVAVVFRPEGRGGAVAQQVSILATPGSTFTFSGRVVHLDLHTGLLVVVDPRDRNSYEIHFDPAVIRTGSELHEGADVIAIASFDGTQYIASTITANSGR